MHDGPDIIGNTLSGYKRSAHNIKVTLHSYSVCVCVCVCVSARACVCVCVSVDNQHKQ